VRLVWAQYALEDRRTIYDHIEADDARAAALVDTRIAEAVTRLVDFPESGRPGRVEARGNWWLAELPASSPIGSRTGPSASCVSYMALNFGQTIFPIDAGAWPVATRE